MTKPNPNKPKTFAEQHPCPECGHTPRHRGTKRVKDNKQFTYLECPACDHRWRTIKLTLSRVRHDSHIPTPAMSRLMLAWVDIGVRQAWGIDTNGRHIKTGEEYAVPRRTGDDL